MKNGIAKILLLAFALSSALAGSAISGISMTGGDNALRRNLVSSGGALSSGTGFSLNCALAETVVSSFSGAGLGFDSGMMHLAAQPGTVVSITAVTKSTGTLDLAWSAPGLDGFLGALSGGFYRIDYSSVPAHVFAPAIYRLQFSTAVTPGEAQGYRLAGLEPNTTYYTRIYLADARKVIAEGSARSDESTLANLPVSPALAGVFASSVAFSWNLPSGGAEGYSVTGSTTNFGALFPGGIVKSSVTDQGVRVTLTMTGLHPDTTYYFRMASLNWQQDVNFDTIIATCTRPAPKPSAIENLASLPEALARRVLYTWNTPESDGLTGVLVQMSTRAISEDLADGTDYHTGDKLADGSVILSSAAGNSRLMTGLLLDSTYYYRFAARNAAQFYSMVVSTECLLDLPPMSPAALQGLVDSGRTQITISWSGVLSNYDGSRFRFTGEPLELSGYEISRATAVLSSSWTLVASVPVSSLSVTVPLPDPVHDYFYRVASVDSRGVPGISMIVDTAQNLYAVAPDSISRIRIPAAMAHVVTPSGNDYSSPIYLAARSRAADEGGKVIRSLEFASISAPDGNELSDLSLDIPAMDVVLHYDTAGGVVVPGSAASALPETLASLSTAVPAEEAGTALGAYWFNGTDYVKVFGTVDTAAQTVTVRSAMPGLYQIRALARSSGVSFDLKEMSNKVITPNGDGKNDRVVFTLDNPRDSAVTGKIYDLTGAFVADMRAGTQLADTLEWDGRARGAVVSRGVYVYQIKAEGKTFNGTIVVIR